MTRPAVAYRIQEITVDGSHIHEELFATRDEARAAAVAKGEKALATEQDEYLIRVDIIWAGNCYREDRWTGWARSYGQNKAQSAA